MGAGMYASGARTTDKKLYAWGWNSVGQLGDGTTTNRSSPVQIGALTTWELVMVARYYMGGIKLT